MRYPVNHKTCSSIIAVPIVLVLLVVFSFPCRASQDLLPETALSYIPESVVALSTEHAIVVDKNIQKLYVLGSKNGTFFTVFEAPCSTGRNSGPKEESGDGKTPEGILFATKAYSDRELSCTYGCMAFHLNYPTVVDRGKGRNGNNIWIHGTNRRLRPFHSNGCIALINTDLERLARYIKLRETPVIIKARINWNAREKQVALKTEIETTLASWGSAVSTGETSQLTGLYKDTALTGNPSLIALLAKIREWKSVGVDVSFSPEHITLMKHGNYITASFDQRLMLDNKTYSCGRRNLYLKKNPDTWHIIGEELLSPMTVHELVTRLESIDTMANDRTDVAQIIRKWVRSWEQGDMAVYASFYSPDFMSRRMHVKDWVSYKTSLDRTNKNLRIQIYNLRILWGATGVTATFTQHYKSSCHSDVGVKRILFKKVDKQWKIYRETWTPLSQQDDEKSLQRDADLAR